MFSGQQREMLPLMGQVTEEARTCGDRVDGQDRLFKRDSVQLLTKISSLWKG